MKNHKGMHVRHEDGRRGVLVRRNASYREWLVDVGGGVHQWWQDPDFTEDPMTVVCTCGKVFRVSEDHVEEEDLNEERLDNIRGNSPAYRDAMRDAGRGRLL